jgi:hypothetical protein
MNNSYVKLLRNLNVVKWELKERNDPSLNLCIQRIKDAIVYADNLNDELAKYQFMRQRADLDVCDGDD